MKLLTFKYNGIQSVGVLSADERHVQPVYEIGLPYKTMNELIEKMTLEEKQQLQTCALMNQGILLEQVEKCAPIPNPKQDIICLGFGMGACRGICTL